VGVDAAQQVIEVGAGEVPVERPGDDILAGFKGSQAVADLVQAVKSSGVRTLRQTAEK
jgi:hypothetical protein